MLVLNTHMNFYLCLVLSVIVGSLAFRSVARTNEWLKPENFTNRPLLLHKSRTAPILVTIGYWLTRATSLLLGWHFYQWIGLVLMPVSVYIISLIIDVIVELIVPLRIRYSFLLNPIVHLYILPYAYVILCLIIILSK